jgi:hypothetical protein
MLFCVNGDNDAASKTLAGNAWWMSTLRCRMTLAVSEPSLVCGKSHHSRSHLSSLFFSPA